MTEPTESALDDRLRRAARRMADHAQRTVDVESDLAWLHSRLRARERGARRPSGLNARPWLAVAAAVALLAGGAVVLLALPRGDEFIETAGSPTTDAPVPATTVANPPVTTGAATTLPPSTTVPGADTFALATAEPAVAAPLQRVTITASESVATCFTTPTAFAVVEDGELRQVAAIGFDGTLTSATVPTSGCEGVPPNVERSEIRIPASLAPGDYVVCLAGIDVAAGCAAITVETWSDSCFDAAIAPPGLIDGSEPGEPNFGADGGVATWGTGRVAVSQVVGARPDQTWVSDFPSGPSAGSLDVLVGLQADAKVLAIVGGPDFCPRRYLISADLQWPELGVLAEGWVEFLAGGAPVPTDRHDELQAPAEYFGVRYYVVGTEGFTAVHRFGPDGTDLGQVDDAELVPSMPGVQLDDGRRILFDPAAPFGERCRNRLLQIDDGSGARPLHPDLADAYTFASTATGIVVATRDVCPEGAAWGDPGTSAQTVLLDLDQPEGGITVLLDEAAVATMPFGRYVTWISPDGRYIGLSEPSSLEASQLTVADVAAPTVPIDLPSGCANASDIVSRPRVVDDRMFVARACVIGGGQFVTVDQLTLPDMSLIWSATIRREMLAYCNCVDISLAPGPVPTMIVTGTSSVEVPNTSILIVGDQQTDVTNLGFGGLAFTVAELLPTLS